MKRVTLHVIFFYSYNAIKGYTKEGRESELSAAEHLVSAAEAGQSYIRLNRAVLQANTRYQRTATDES